MEENSAELLPYDAGIFIDNEEANIQSVNQCGPQMKGILVPSKKKPFINRYYGEIDPYVAGLTPEGQDVAAVFQIFAKLIQERYEKLDIGSGIGPQHIKEIEQWVTDQKAEDSSKRLVALFDWDRTLSIIEGFYMLGNDGIDGAVAYFKEHEEEYLPFKIMLQHWDKVTIEGFVDYYCGGPQRVAMLQNMFDFLYAEGVDIFVLTNNPACYHNRKLMEEMMGVLTRNRKAGFLCSNVLGGISKKNAIQRSQEFAEQFTAVCPSAPTGGTRKKRKGKLTTRKNTKRR